MRAGKMRHLCSFQSRGEAVDEYGNTQNGVWSEFWSDYGDLDLETGAERLRGGRLVDAPVGNLWVRSFTETRAITADHRVVIAGVAYMIRAVVSPPDSDKIEMTIEQDRTAA